MPRFGLPSLSKTSQSLTIPDTPTGSSHEQSVVIRHGERCFLLPHSATKKLPFQRSKFASALKLSLGTAVDVGEMFQVTRVGDTELYVQAVKADEQQSADFALLISQLLGHNPLENFGFASLYETYQRLLRQAKAWGLHKLPIALPYRLWTAARWSDLVGVYVLQPQDAEWLRMVPVAIQLEDGTVQGVRPLNKLNLDDPLPETISQTVKTMLHAASDIHKITGVFYFPEVCVVLLDSTAMRVELGESTGLLTLSPSSEESFAASTTAGEPMADQILVKLDGSDKIAAYDLARHEALRVPSGKDFPVFYRRTDRRIIYFSSAFALEVQEMTDAVSGATKIRCGLSRQESKSSGSPQAAVMSYFKGPSAMLDKKSWQCWHPQLSAKYGTSVKWIRDFGDVSRVKLFPWGACLISSKADAEFAVLAVDNRKLRAMYADRIAIHVKGFPHAAYSRADIDVTVSPDLSRVYLCCCSQIASASILPKTASISFEIAEVAPKQYRLQLVHVDIPVGAPSGSSLGELHCVGVLSEFDTKTGLYYQNTLCKQVCRRYVAPSSPGGQIESHLSDESDSEREST